MVARYIPHLIAVGAVLAAYKIFNIDEVIYNLTVPEIQDSYDYIIVGGGTSGSVLASRISEDSDKTVLVLEAGEDPGLNNENIDIPVFADAVRNSKFDWAYKTVPQKHSCKAHVDQSALWSSGKGLGGSSLLNYMHYIRGSRHDFDGWAQNGAAGWAYKDVLPYFIKSEDNRNGENVRTVFHGFGGRMTVSDIELSPINKVLQRAFKELGFKIREPNGKSMYGYSVMQATIRNGLRWSTYRAFLRRAMKRSNVHIITGATAQKILFEGRRASGVLFKQGDKQQVIKAKKEVIVAAGAVGSPKLLMLSGVGPRQHLQALKIPVVADLPVGDNLQDQVMTDGITFYTNYTGISITVARAENFASQIAYNLFGTGQKGSPRFREGQAYIKTRHQPPHIKYPLIGMTFVANSDPYTAPVINVEDDYWQQLHDKPKMKDGFTVYPSLLHPKSKGSIRLRSNNPEDPPLINPNYFAEDADVKYLAEAIKFIRSLINSEPIKDWEFFFDNHLLESCSQYGNWTTAYIDCFIRQVTIPAGSAVGTCRMGAQGDPSAVVDPFLRVRTVKNLRVVDASVIPTSTSGNTYTSQIMIAEKASDMIRGKDTVQAIRDYFKQLIEQRNKKLIDEDEAEEEKKNLAAAAAAAAAAKEKAQKKKKF